MKTLIIDIERCVGCRNCQLACKDEHVGNDWSPIAQQQPEGHFWMNVTETERGVAPKVVVDWMPVMCLHCDNAPCIPACHDKAIYKREDGIVIIDPDKCTGCGDCMEACPYGVIYLNDELEICQKCTMCAHLLDDGWEEPRCVTACPADALIFGEVEELGEYLVRAEEWKPETDAQPRVKYIGLPKPFVAGDIFSPKEDACIEGATLTLTDLITGKKSVTNTDNYGDFWFTGLDSNSYTLTIEKEGYYPKKLSNIHPDANLQAITLYKR